MLNFHYFLFSTLGIYRSWQNGICGRWNSCPLRHYYRWQVAEAKKFQDLGVNINNVDISSHYTIKVRDEVESQRLKEDLDTRRIRSWVETKENEVAREPGAAEKQRVNSTLPGRQPAIKRGSMRVPLADIMVTDSYK